MGRDVDVRDASDSCLQQLMSRYQQADGTAVRLLIEQLSPQFLRFFSSQLGCRTDVEDLLQDLRMRIHQARHTSRRATPPPPPVYVIPRCGRTAPYPHQRPRQPLELPT